MSGLRRLADPRVLLGLLSILLVVVYASSEARRINPGPLSASHGAMAELRGAEGCDVCHGRGGETMVRACLNCHDEIATQLAQARGLHGSFEGEHTQRCETCHVEHHGDEVLLSGDLAFARAGFDTVAEFDHAHVLFELHGRHTELDCEACHANANATMLVEGQVRFLGEEQACASCHDDPHEGTYSNACATCHGQEHPFAAVASFAHGDAFPLVGAHGRPGCAECHPSEGATSIASLAIADGLLAARDCQTCHDDPHTGDFVSAVAASVGVRTESSCGLCHDAVHDTFATDEAFDTRFHDAAFTGFELDAPHDGLACAACHADADDVPRGQHFAERFPGREREDCAACHADAHGGQFAAGGTSAFAGAACIDCHTREAFEPHGFGRSMHARAAFALTGAHLAADCADCHVPAHPAIEADAGGAPLVFAAADAACANCHEDPHGGTFDAFHGLDAGEGCAQCHTTTAFDDVDRANFDHGWTRFELVGAHGELDCAACHAELDRPDELGRTFARVVEPPQGFAACSGCHADVHRGHFDAHLPPQLDAVGRARMRTLLDGERGCARCHDERTFARVDARVYDHGAWTGFDLEGAHDAIACHTCHGDNAAVEGPLAARDFGFAHERWGGDLTACATCHADPHRGAFDGVHRVDSLGRTGCARCHTTDSFELEPGGAFDHGVWTGFELTGAHAEASCADCHTRPRRGEGASSDLGLGFARGSACADCHADPHVGQFATGGRTDCASCHASTVRFTDLDFDHDVDTRFPLDAQHAALDCSACHTDHALQGGREVTRYKPLGTSCADCHGFDGSGR